MKIVLTVILLFLSLFAETPKVVVINSNDKLEKYSDSYLAFKDDFEGNFSTIVVSDMKSREIKEYLYDEYPDIIYTIGSQAYQYAHLYTPEKEIYFSSIVNWKRLPTTPKTFGVSHELHSEMQLTLIKTLFPEIKKIGVVYSRYTEDLINEFQERGKNLGIEIVAHRVFEGTSDISEFHSFMDNIEALTVIPEPTLFRKESLLKEVLTLAKKRELAIFSYHKLFLDYGAVLIISADNQTTGRQISAMISSRDRDGEKVQYPAGTNLIFNKRVADNIGLEYNPVLLYMFNEIVE